MPTAPSCPTTSYHNSSGRSLKRPLDLQERRTALPSSGFRYFLTYRLLSTCTRQHTRWPHRPRSTLSISPRLSRSPPSAPSPHSPLHPPLPAFLFFSLSPFLSVPPAFAASLDSFPLRLVLEGNKDGSAYVQPATGGGARLPSVGRTNANDSSMQDGVGIRRTMPLRPARELLLYLACDVQPARRMHRVQSIVCLALACLYSISLRPLRSAPLSVMPLARASFRATPHHGPLWRRRLSSAFRNTTFTPDSTIS